MKLPASFPQTIPTERGVVYASSITPEAAQYILSNHNPTNRKIKQTAIDGYTREMLCGRWKTGNGQFVCFDSNGNLVSGQHRLMAIIKAGIAVALDFSFGNDPNASDTVDTGVGRGVGDQIFLKTGDSNANFNVVTANGLKKLLTSRRDKGTVGFTLLMLEEFQRGIDVVKRKVMAKSLFGRSTARGAIALAAEAYPIKVGQIIERVTTGQAQGSGEKALAAYALGGSLRTEHEDKVGAKVLHGLYMALTDGSVERLQTRGHEDRLDFFLDAIRRNHAVTSTELIRASGPMAVDANA